MMKLLMPVLLATMFFLSNCTPKIAEKVVEEKKEVQEKIEEESQDGEDNEDEQDTTKPKVDRSLPPDLLGGDEPNPETTTTLKIYDAEVDLGTIEFGDSIRHTFKYKNIGSIDFFIEQYTVGCGCTEIDKPEKRIKPGETGSITLQFNSKEKEGPGDYTSDALLVCNVPEGFIEFSMKIKVVEKKE